ncbi:glutamate--tRNA ligase [Oleiphilus sp. HI0071]|jgi:glutamyl-tRNA synthetase|nr:glutamate--tRNA ligase [Oleiphilus sp. HI0065]KZY82032.1 glutamate--tRNA ligase [Oleiphilus sp. HI0071]KZY91162.1 glutamate--tRNA ligase [Oleiphilus sp. HI0073]KZZ42184.1 glutamate--tRNA ligase [Oleiphilus sp. HI0118]KZZ60369.1 glutamate--tRNA ligase [Oleiphilus sp. HI0122]KZZ81989.1 glutamate--tRNA ligase [Oleiphilus sp. HI0133]
MTQTVRTRIAPSPTGDPHVGTAYIALFNMCFAKQHNGKFILRIEDTDQARSTPESEAQILDALRWLGLNWDEGPDVGGPYGPYRQSERKHDYAAYAERLVNEGKAFYCFRTPEELDVIREERKAAGLNPGIKGALELPSDEVERRLAAGEPHVIRMKVPDEGTCVIEDMLRGTIEIDWAQVDCQILLKSDGMPTYHLANVVDDHLMAITHVIRGEEWINSAPKHKLLYEYFDWEMPVLCHMPLLRNPDKSKLSKRKNPTSITYYERVGFMPEAVTNYLGRMGYSLQDEREKFSLAEMIETFDIQRVSLGGPIFDVEKLSWLNGLWIRENLSDEEFASRAQEWAFNAEFVKPMLEHIKGRVETFSDIAPLASFMFSGMLNLDRADFAHKKLEEGQVKRVLQFALWTLESQRHWNKENVFGDVKALAKAMEIKMGDFMQPLFVAVAGTPNSWSVVDSMVMLGPDMTRARLRHALNVMEGFSKKETKRVEKEYQAVLVKIST